MSRETNTLASRFQGMAIKNGIILKDSTNQPRRRSRVCLRRRSQVLSQEQIIMRLNKKKFPNARPKVQKKVDKQYQVLVSA